MADGGKMKKLMSGPALSVLARSSLWVDQNYLLTVEQRGGQERYRRFYFEDIQALIICGTDRRFFIGLALGILMAIGLVVLVAASSLEGRITGGILMAFPGIGLLINFVKGPGCVCHLRTAVSVSELAAVKRLRKIERALPELKARIAEKQGQTDPEEMALALEARREAIASDASRPVESVGAGRPRLGGVEATVGAHYSGHLHLAFFSLLLADAALALLAFVGTHPLLVGVRLVVVMTALFCGIVALIRYRKGAALRSLRPSTIAGTVYLALGAIGIYVLFTAMYVQYPETSYDTVALFRILGDTGPYDGMVWLLFFILNAGLSGLLGAVGLLHTVSYRGRKERGGAPPIPSGP